MRLQNNQLVVWCLFAAAIVGTYPASASAVIGTWSGGTAGWVAGTPGWDVVPNGVGDIGTYPITSFTPAATTQDTGGNVTLGTLSLTGELGSSWTVTPTNPIIFDQDGTGAGVATITNSNADTGTLNFFTLGAGTLTLADDLLVTNTGGSTSNGAIALSSAIGGTGNVTFSSVAPVVADSIAGSIRILGANTFTGNVLLQKGVVSQTSTATPFGNAANVVTIGEVGQGAVAHISTNNFNTPNPIVVPAGVGPVTLGSTYGNNSTGYGYSGSVTLNSPIIFSSLANTGVGNLGLNMSGLVSGTGSITKMGTGLATLTSTVGNTYTGDTIINEGILQANGGLAIPDGPGAGNVVIGSAGTLRLVSNEVINGLTGTGTVSSRSNNRTLSVGRDNSDSTFSGMLALNGTRTTGLTKVGTGVTTLDGSTQYSSTGTIRVNNYGAKLRVDLANIGTDLVNPGSLLQLSGGTIEILGQSTGTSSQTFSALNMGVNAGHDNTILISPNGGAGTSITITSPTITRNVGHALNFATGTGTGTATLNWGAANTNGIIGGFAVFNGTTWAVGGTPVSELADGSYITTTTNGNAADSYGAADHIDVTSSPILNGAISVSDLRFNGAAASTVTLQGNNSLNSGGILVTSAVGSNTSSITGGTLAGKGTGTGTPLANFVTTAGVSAVADLIVHQYNTGGILDINSTIADGAGVTALTKVGPGVLKLSNASNSYSGLTYAAGGTLQIGAASGATTGVIPHGAGKGGVYLQANLDLHGFDTTVNAIVVNSTGKITSSVAGPVTLTIGDADGIGSTNLGIIEDGSGVLSLRKVGAGTVTATTIGYGAGSQATYSGGTSIEGGSITLQVDSMVSSGPLGTGTVTLNGGTLNNDAAPRVLGNAINVAADAVMVGNSNVNSLTLTGAITGSGALDASTTTTSYMFYLGSISGFTGTFKLGDASTNNRVHFSGTMAASLDGSNATFDASPTAVSGNVMFRWGAPGNTLMKMGELKGTSAIATLTPVASLGTATLEAGQKNTSSTFAGQITEPGGTAVAFTKVGSGNLTLTNAQLNTGNTTVSAGTLTLGATGSLATTPTITVANSATLDVSAIGAGLNVGGGAVAQTLKGNGTVTGNISLGSMGTIAPGNSAGALTVSGNLDLSAGGHYNWELTALSTSGAGTNFDSISVANAILDGTSVLDVNFGLLPGGSVPTGGNAFWNSSHSWKIIDTAGDFGTSLFTTVNGTSGAGTWGLTRGSGTDLGDLFLNYTIAALLTGDVNGDHIVNQLDLNVVFGNWLSTGATLAQGDANHDGVINQLDINTITGNWLATGPTSGLSSNSVPEPASGVLMALGFLSLMGYRRKNISSR